MDAPRSPQLDELLRRVAAAGRRRAAVRAALGAWVAGSGTVVALEVVRRLAKDDAGAPFGHLTVAAAGGAVAAAVACAVALTAARSRDEERVARDLDRRLALDDVAATTLALTRGRVRSPLAVHVIAHAAPVLAAASSRIDATLRAPTPADRRLRRAAWVVLAGWLVVAALLVADLLDWFRLPFGGLRGGGAVPGIVPDGSPGAPLPAPRTQPGGGPEPRPDATAPTAGAAAPPPRPPDPPAPPAPRPAPDVEARVKPSRESFPADAPVLVVVSAIPTRPQTAERTLAVDVELDGAEPSAPTRFELRLGPGNPQGAGEIVDLRRVPALANRLAAGEHTVRVRLRAGDGAVYESRPATFRIDGESGGGSQRPDPNRRTPRPSPSAAQPDPPAPQGQRPPDRAPTAGAPPEEIAPKFEPQVVVPLFGAGDEVTKRGPTVVLVPGGGTPGEAPRPAELAEALPDAAKRAEASVDRGAVRKDDADLVRRYFEALQALGR